MDDVYMRKPNEAVVAMARRIVAAKGDAERDSAHDDCADQVAAELLRLSGAFEFDLLEAKVEKDYEIREQGRKDGWL